MTQKIDLTPKYQEALVLLEKGEYEKAAEILRELARLQNGGGK